MNIERGMSGEVVRKVQQRLAALGLYTSPIDSSFGGGTESAVKQFQKRQDLAPTGRVDTKTWTLLLPDDPAPTSPFLSSPMILRCLALTGSFETGSLQPDCFCGLVGDFDRQGISFGVLQWNLGQGSLQPLLQDAFEKHPDVCQSIFHEHFETVKSLGQAPRSEQLEFARSIQNHRGQLNEPWRGMLKTLGRTSEFQTIQVDHASPIFQKAVQMCSEYGLRSERAVALMFDIITQNGGIGSVVKAQIQSDFSAIVGLNHNDSEVAKMRSVANRRAAASKLEYVDDVRTRKLTIAEGMGVVHGINYDLEATYSITLNDFLNLPHQS